MSRQTDPEAKLRENSRIPGTTSWDASQALINRKIGAEWLDLEKHVAWHGGWRLDQVICKVNEEGWLLILKAHRNGRRAVAFIQAETMPEAYELCGEFAARGVLTWQPDKWPPKKRR